MSGLHFLGSISVLKAGHHPALCPSYRGNSFFHSANIYWVLTYLTTINVSSLWRLMISEGTAWLCDSCSLVQGGAQQTTAQGTHPASFVNKVSLEQSHAQLSTCFLWLFKKKKKQALLRYSSYTIRFTFLNFTTQWFLVCSQGCRQIQELFNFRSFSAPSKETPCLSNHLLLLLPTSPWNHS